MLDKKSLPYIVPFTAYILLGQAVSLEMGLYHWLYPICCAGVAAITIFFLRGRNIIRPHLDIMPGIAFGVAGIVLWIGLCNLDLEKGLFALLPAWLVPAPRPAFNPFTEIENHYMLWFFIISRIASLAILVPVVEELFWRGWLIRWIVSDDWEQVPMGKYTLQSFLWVTVLFALAHPEWLAAAAWCAMINLLFYWKKDLWNCMVAHGVSNLLLGIYVMSFEAWYLW